MRGAREPAPGYRRWRLLRAPGAGVASRRVWRALARDRPGTRAVPRVRHPPAGAAAPGADIMSRDGVLRILVLLLVAAAALWFVTATEWAEVDVAQPAKGEAAKNRLYAMQSVL